MADLIQRIVIAFNTFWSAFLQDLKSVDDNTKKLIRDKYKLIDKTSDEHLKFFHAQMPADTSSYVDKDAWTDVIIVDSPENEQKITIKDVLQSLTQQKRDCEIPVIWNHIFTLALFAHLFDLRDEKLFDVSLEAISKAQHHKQSAEEALIDILDDETRALLKEIIVETTREVEDATQPAKNPV